MKLTNTVPGNTIPHFMFQSDRVGPGVKTWQFNISFHVAKW